MYIVVENKQVSGDNGIVNEVNSHLDKGFVPIGGLMFNNGYYYQTMFCFDEVAVAPIPKPIKTPDWREITILRIQQTPGEFDFKTWVKYRFRNEEYSFETDYKAEFDMPTQSLCLDDWLGRAK